MKRRRRKKHTPDQLEQQRRGRKIFLVLWRSIFTVVLVVAAIAAMTVFFKVKTISVEGAMKYGADEIIAGMDVKKGDNLYLWNKKRVITDLLHDFPYLETVQLRRKLPDALVLTVTECSAAAAVKNEDGTFTYISAAGKVLEQDATNGSLPVVIGVSLNNVNIGDFLQTATEVHIDAMLEVLKAMDAGDMLDKLQFLNVKDLTDIRIGYGTQFDLRIGTLDDLAYRLRFAQTVIEERLSPSDIGRLYWDQQDRLHFVPDTAENVARSGTDQASDAPVTSPAYTNPDGEVGTTPNTDGAAAADSSTDSSDNSDSTDTSDSTDYSEDSSYDDSYDDGSYDDSYDSYDDESYYDDSSYDDSSYDEG